MVALSNHQSQPARANLIYSKCNEYHTSADFRTLQVQEVHSSHLDKQLDMD